MRSGATVNPAPISGLSDSTDIAIIPSVAPEPSSFLLLVSGGLAMMMIPIIRSARPPRHQFLTPSPARILKLIRGSNLDLSAEGFARVDLSNHLDAEWR